MEATIRDTKSPLDIKRMFDEQVIAAHQERIEGFKRDLLTAETKEIPRIKHSIDQDTKVIKTYSDKLGLNETTLRSSIAVQELLANKVIDIGVHEHGFFNWDKTGMFKQTHGFNFTWIRNLFAAPKLPKTTYVVYRENGVMYAHPESDYDEVMVVLDENGELFIENNKTK